MKLTKSKLKEIIREEIQKLNEGGTGIVAPVQKAKSERDAVNQVKKMIKDDRNYGGDYGNLKGVKFVGNTTEDKLDRLGQRYEDRYAIVGVVDNEYWFSMWARV